MLPIQQFDKVFSDYIRLKDADWKGWNHCYTCGKPSYWKYLQAGHFINRKDLATRFDERNCKPCCYNCNCILEGSLEVYKQKLIEEYGEIIIHDLENLSKSTYKWSRSEMLEKIAFYKTQINKLLNHEST